MNKDTHVKVDKNFFHLKTCKGSIANYICAWCIQNISSLKLISSQCFSERNNGSQYNLSIYIGPDPNGIKIEIKTFIEFNRFDISIASRSGKVPLKHKLYKSGQSFYTVYRAIIGGENFQKLKRFPDDTAVIICRMKYIVGGRTVTEPTPTMNSEYMNSLKAELKQCSSTSKEKVSLRVGEETECVNKTILCIRSPVFAKMLENDMKELEQNTVTIADIKMPVLRVLINFLYYGAVLDCEFDFLCQLYYAADKYDVKDLRLACIASLVSKASLDNLLQLLKLSLLHNDELLKSVAMTLIYNNIDVVILRLDWKNFIHDDPEIALEAATYFDLN